MSVLVTGAAGFIGCSTCLRLLERGEQVIGVDEINDYYDPALKHARLQRLRGFASFRFHRIDIADRAAMTALSAAYPDISSVVSLAAQAGVRYSLENPFAYSRSNVEGHLAVLELCRGIKGFRHLVYASSSSVYGANTKLPFALEDRVDSPVSLYAATKKAGELMAHAYSHLYRIPMTGLRFFTVYGPWGRPDMAYYLFADAITAGRPIRVFNNGDMRRDFTYIDDVIDGVIGCLDNPPPDDSEHPPQRVYNIGNNKTESLMRFIAVLEDALGRKADIRFEPMQPGDVKETYADISAIERDIGFRPKTPIEIGIPAFVDWYRAYRNL